MLSIRRIMLVLAICYPGIAVRAQTLDTSSRYSLETSLTELLQGPGRDTILTALSTVYLTAPPNELPFVALVRIAQSRLTYPDRYLDVQYALTEIEAQHKLKLTEFASQLPYALHTCCAAALDGLGRADILLLARERMTSSFESAGRMLEQTETLIRSRLEDRPGSDVDLIRSVRFTDVRITWGQNVIRGKHALIGFSIHNDSDHFLDSFSGVLEFREKEDHTLLESMPFNTILPTDLAPGESQDLFMRMETTLRLKLQESDALLGAKLSIDLIKVKDAEGVETVAYYKLPGWEAKLRHQLLLTQVVRDIVEKLYTASLSKMI